MKIQGRIEDKEVTQKDDWTRALFTIEGKKYSTFDKKIIADFNKGDVIEIETKLVEKDGKQYNNMVSMKKIEEKVGNSEKVAENGSNKEFHLSIEECRCRCVESALKQLEMCNTTNIKSQMVLDVAQYLFGYVWNGRKKEEMPN
jgi:hypothetical protein